MAPGFFAANPCYPLCVNGPDAGSAQLTDCHIEAAPDGSAIPAPGGTVKVSCTWNAPSERCPPDSTACVACNPESELCDPTTGICSSLCGCGGCWTSSVTVSADLPTDDAGTILPTTCSDLCPIPDAGPSTPTGVPECHPEYGPTGQPVVCDGQVVLACVWSQGCVGGRRPEGFVPRVGERGLGAYWAQAATLETASIPAFRRLERELAHHGAPVELQRRARRAARDEIRHARAMTALARQHGAHPDRVEWVDGGLRSLVQIAQENAVEGCVRETFGAALAMWQAEHAADGTVRRTMATIAEDEADHAELAWDVAIWIEARLTDAERRAVQDERLQAQRELELSLDAETDEALTAGAGLPPRAQAGALFRAIQREL